MFFRLIQRSVLLSLSVNKCENMIRDDLYKSKLSVSFVFLSCFVAR